MFEPTAGEYFGKTALITGASQQMGREVAKALSAFGVRLGLVGRSREGLRTTLESVGDAEAHTYVADLRNQDDIIRLVGDVRTTLGPVDYLIHIASAWHNGQTSYFPCSFEGTSLDRVNEMLDVGLRGPLLLTHQLLPDMKRRGGGRVIVTSDTYDGAHDIAEWISYYYVNKAVEAFTYALGTEVRPYGMTVNCVASDYIDVDSINKFFPDEAKASIPPDYWIRFVLFLLSSAGEHINGQVIGLRSKDAPLSMGVTSPQPVA